MKKVLGLLLIVLLGISSCKKEESITKIVELTISIEGITENVSPILKAGEFENQITNIEYTVTDVITGVEQQLAFGSSSIALPTGEYIVRAYSNLNFSTEYLMFDVSSTIMLTENTTIVLIPELQQLLVTVYGAIELTGPYNNVTLIAPTYIDNELLYRIEDIYYIYLQTWDGNIRFKSINYVTQADIAIGNEYSYTLNSAGIVIDTPDFNLIDN